MSHVYELSDQLKGPEDDAAGVRFWLSENQVHKIAKFAGEQSVELEWRGAGYYMARVYDPDTREMARERMIQAHETRS